jgi:hypothetical protein
MPTATDLVTDLPADFEVFGQAVATSLADLLGGTSGQVLAKNSNTDMDFVWVAQDDSNAIQNSIVDAKGDLVAASANDTPARLAVGANGTVLTADSAEATGLKWVAPSATIGSAQNFVSTQQGTSSLTYTGLTTAQSVTLTTGTKVMVVVGANLQTINAEERAFMSYAISGATTSAASDNYAVVVCSSTAYDTDQQSYVSYRTVTAGSNTFTAQFRTAGSTTMEAGNRTLIVIDWGS